jgi:hypothetical protein
VSLTQALSQLLTSPAGQAVYGLTLLMFANAALGIAKTVSNKTFEWSWVDLFVRTKIAGRLVPIVVVLLIGTIAPDLSLLGLTVNPFTAAGLAAAVPVAASELASILENIRFGQIDRVPEGAPQAGTYQPGAGAATSLGAETVVAANTGTPADPGEG